MKILRMHLENFQGLKDFDLAADGKDVALYGDNGTGKSTIYNAFTWLMYGKASTDEKNYTPKTVDTHHLNHIVDMTMEMDDGSQLTLRKDFHEVYKTKKGNPDPVFSGHTSDYYIDGVPVNETEFNERLTELYKSEELAKMLTSYSYFLEDMKVKDRRQKLLEICGDVDFDAVIKSTDELKGLPGLLKKPGDTDSLYKVEEYQAIAAKEKKLIDKKLKEIPGRIDEVEKAKPDAINESREDLDEKLKKLNKEKIEIEAGMNASKVSAAAESKADIAEAKKEYAEAEVAYINEAGKGNEALRAEIRKLQEQADDIEAELNRNIKKKNERIENARFMTERREALLEEFKKISQQQWQGNETCPTCGQPLPMDQIEKAKEEFNISRSKALESIKERGQVVSKDSIEVEKQKAEELAELISSGKNQLLEVKALLIEKKGAIKELPPFDETAEGIALSNKVTELQKRLDSTLESSDDARASDMGKIEVIENEIKVINLKLASLDLIEKQLARRAELEDEEEELAKRFEQLSYGLYLCDLYAKTKAALLDEKVNSHFDTLRFRLFIEQQNGGVMDDCEALIPCSGTYVPFKSANNASRINAGLEVIDALEEFYGVNLPVFIDNAESTTSIRKTKAQQIKLYVSGKDKKLRAANE